MTRYERLRELMEHITGATAEETLGLTEAGPEVVAGATAAAV